MMKHIEINKHKTFFYEQSLAGFLRTFSKQQKTILLIDENVFKAYATIFKSYDYYVIASGEASKSFSSVQKIIQFLLQKSADRKTHILAIGGGVVTDLVGFVSSIYMRGVSFGFVPTTVLAMVDASIGGKNGINLGLYKNMVGTTTQPNFLLYDYDLLQTLPRELWVEGFAEVIKHALLFDPKLFALLEENDISTLQKNKQQFQQVVARNVELKYKIVKKDPGEKHERKLLNFGHTIAHGLERKARIPHGKAVSIGMQMMMEVSQKHFGFKQLERAEKLLQQYELPIHTKIDLRAVWDVMLKDKKKTDNKMTDIILQAIGKPLIKDFTLKQYEAYILPSSIKR